VAGHGIADGRTRTGTGHLQLKGFCPIGNQTIPVYANQADHAMQIVHRPHESLTDSVNNQPSKI
jgi:hypothetical protein